MFSESSPFQFAMNQFCGHSFEACELENDALKIDEPSSVSGRHSVTAKEGRDYGRALEPVHGRKWNESDLEETPAP